MFYGTIPAGEVKVGDYVMPPHNRGQHKEVVMITPAGRWAVFIFADASKMSADKRDKVCVGVKATGGPPLNGGA
jgi:hypothetical protein